MRRTPEATSRPPRPPTRLNPSAMRKVGTCQGSYQPRVRRRTRGPKPARQALRSDVALSGAHGVAPFADIDADRVPAAVLFERARIAQEVLFAQLVGDARRRVVQALEPAHDLRAAARVVRDLPQRVRVDPLARRRRPARAARLRKPWPPTTAGERNRDGE